MQEDTKRSLVINYGVGFLMVALAAWLGTGWWVVGTAFVGAALVLHGHWPSIFTVRRVCAGMAIAIAIGGALFVGLYLGKRNALEVRNIASPVTLAAIPVAKEEPPKATPAPRVSSNSIKAINTVSAEMPKAKATSVTVPPSSASTSFPPVIQNAPQGINIGPGALAPHAQVNNFGPPEPKLTWRQSQGMYRDQTPNSQDTAKPSVEIILSVDRTMEIPAFVAMCDKPCKTMTFRPMLQTVMLPAGDTLQNADNPSITGIVLKIPRPLGAGIGVQWTVEGVDGSPVHIADVEKLPADQVPQR